MMLLMWIRADMQLALAGATSRVPGHNRIYQALGEIGGGTEAAHGKAEGIRWRSLLKSRRDTRKHTYSIVAKEATRANRVDLP